MFDPNYITMGQTLFVIPRDHHTVKKKIKNNSFNSCIIEILLYLCTQY